MKNLIKKILKEDSEQRFINSMVDRIKSGLIKAPYFKNLESYGGTNEEIEDILSVVFNGEVDNALNLTIYNKMGYMVYMENYFGSWEKREYDENGNKVYYETSDRGVIFDKR